MFVNVCMCVCGNFVFVFIIGSSFLFVLGFDNNFLIDCFVLLLLIVSSVNSFGNDLYGCFCIFCIKEFVYLFLFVFVFL